MDLAGDIQASTVRAIRVGTWAGTSTVGEAFRVQARVLASAVVIERGVPLQKLAGIEKLTFRYRDLQNETGLPYPRRRKNRR
jgi:hypothetical protein